MIIEMRSAWDSLLEIIHSDQVKAELVFWQENIVKLNRKYLAGYKNPVPIYPGFAMKNSLNPKLCQATQLIGQV
jgi:hypothetical protein